MWYYMQRGNVRERKILSDDQLTAMAREGELDKDDLLWRAEGDQKWVRASSVPDLLVEPEPPRKAEPEEKPGPLPGSETKPQKPEPAPEKGHGHKSAVVAAVIAIIAIIAVLAANKVKGLLQEPESPPPPPPPPEETNTWQTVEADLTALLKGGMIEDANDLISAYAADRGEDAVAARLRSALSTHLKSQQLQKMYEAFIRGQLDAGGKKELLSLSRELGDMEKLKKSLALALTAKRPPSEELCRSILDLSRILTDEPLELAALEALAKVLKADTSEEGCLEMVKVYAALEMADKAITLLQQFVETNPESANAWYELTAHLAQADKNDEALEALKVAMKLGGKDARIDARRDERFDSIKDTLTFKWNTR